jgi:hypothetical protein
MILFKYLQSIIHFNKHCSAQLLKMQRGKIKKHGIIPVDFISLTFYTNLQSWFHCLNSHII